VSHLACTQSSCPALVGAVTLGQLALQIARRDLRAAGIAVRQSNVQSMFTNEMGINTASTLVQRISAVCEAALREHPAI
jgi:hypothetical protein